MRRAIKIVLGVAWVVGVYIALKHLPTGVHHWFQPRYCYLHEADEGWATTCVGGHQTLSLAIWLGLTAAPFVGVHYFRKWRTEVERKARQEGELAGMMNAEARPQTELAETELADLLSDD